MFMNIFVLMCISVLQPSLQFCPEEISDRGIPVIWRKSKEGRNIVSDPLCYHEGQLITRQCNGTAWIPSLKKTKPCLAVFGHYDVSSCPPQFNRVSNKSNKYCYQIEPPSVWDYPCLKSGGASVITDLSTEEFDSLISSLRQANISQMFWLPAQRRKLFNPLVWIIPGPNWGQVVSGVDFNSISSIFKNCLLLDVDRGVVRIETCSRQIPSLCIFLNDLQYPAKCPDGYHAFRFISGNGTCFGIEHSTNSTGLTYDGFLTGKCKKLMGDSIYDDDLTRFLFKKIAQLSHLPENCWCWFATLGITFEQLIVSKNKSATEEVMLEGIINNNGTLGLKDSRLTLPCMACETDIIYHGDTELHLEYNYEEVRLFLTIYYQSGLWKYDDDDIGVQCFSDAKGFVKPIDVNSKPIIAIDFTSHNIDSNCTQVEKTVFSIDLVTDRSAQYWCEGHSKGFSLLSTSKVIANPRGNQVHVFSLTLQKYIFNETAPNKTEFVEHLTALFAVEKVLLMDILEYTTNHTVFLFHLHAAVVNYFDNAIQNLQATYQNLKNTAMFKLPDYNAKFINISSSTHCLPTTSEDYITLDWELTLIGHIAAPKQFCLQRNGLPVKRRCRGSYMQGGFWDTVEGHCNEAYEPSNTTTFLYKFFKGQFSENYTATFLTHGLSFVLEDIDIIIPADIYYLSVSLQHVLNIAQQNESSIDMGDIDNMAWAMDRILLLNYRYLRLSQIFNSTNLILDSVNDIIERLARRTQIENRLVAEDLYKLSVKPQFIVQISYPEFNNITGLALARKRQCVRDSFDDMLIHLLYKNSTLDSVLSIENLEVAVWIPENVLKNLERITNATDEDPRDKENIHIVGSIYHNDGVFQQLDATKITINSRIVGLTIPGYKTNLANPIPVVFRQLNSTDSKRHCGYWDFDVTKSGENPGFWSTQGCYFKQAFKNLTVCECYHLTNFGQLLDLGEDRGPGGATCFKCHTRALNIITLIGSFLSLLGTVGIWITAMVFQSWRKKPGTKVLLQLSTAIAMPLVFMVVFNLDNTMFENVDEKYIVAESKKFACVLLGSLLQYSILASFMWMLIIAILQFIRYVRVLGVCRPSRFIVKFAILGWGLPLIPVIVILAVDFENYIPEPTNDPEKRICYPKGTFLVLGIIIPIVVVLIINVTLFILILISISKGPEGKMRSTDMDLIGAQLRLSLFLFFLLGLTWVFGIFSFTNNLVWSYLFCLTSTLQGFAMFVYFVICDPATRNLWVSLMKPQFLAPSPRKSISSISSG